MLDKSQVWNKHYDQETDDQENIYHFKMAVYIFQYKATFDFSW